MALHPIDAYARAVLRGKIPAGKYHRLACARHVRDLAAADSRRFPYRLDYTLADRFLRFGQHLKHYKGEWAGRAIIWQPWQIFTLGSVFGWVHVRTGLRRFRHSYKEIPRKNGKSLESAVVGIYVTFFDGEPGAEGYCLDPNTRVLLADLSWKPIGALNVGDELIAVDEDVQAFRNHRKLRAAQVLNTRVTRRHAVRITFESGQTLVCSADHKWLSRSLAGVGFRWRMTRDLRPGYRIAYLGAPWHTDQSWTAGYLAGLYDGEGYLHAPTSAGAGFRIGFSQKSGVVLDGCLEHLHALGFAPLAPRPHAGGTLEFSISGLYDCLRLLGSIRPRRLWLKSRALWEGKTFTGTTQTIARIDLLPPTDLVDIETSARTFIADGFISHNCAAMKRDQSKIVWGDAKQLVTRSGLAGRIRVLNANLSHPRTASKLEPLGADVDSHDGLNPHFVSLDEIHKYKTRAQIDVIETATMARRQPLIFKITTAGESLQTPCGEEHVYACHILDRTLTDDTYFAFIAHADLDDDWTKPATARKANPSYGVTVKPEDLAAKVRKAVGMPAARAAYQQKNLNLWVNAGQPWLSLDGWRAGQSTDWTLDDLRGRPCFIGCDLASKLDLSAMALVFPPATDGERWKVVVTIWSPGDTLEDRGHRDRAPYVQWRDAGYLVAPEGTRLNVEVVRAAILAVRPFVNIQRIGFDPSFATPIIDKLVTVDGFAPDQVLDVPQTFRGMSAGALELEGAVLAGQVDAGGHPVVEWCIGNAVVRKDDNEGILPSKRRSRGRIDAVTAMCIGWNLAIREREPEVASDPDLLVV